MARTTILLEDQLLLDVRRVAQTKGTTLTEIIREALTAYVDSQPRGELPSFTAVGSRGSARSPRARASGARDAEKLARQAVDPYEGSAREGRR
jgi:hypothetical protein